MQDYEVLPGSAPTRRFNLRNVVVGVGVVALVLVFAVVGDNSVSRPDTSEGIHTEFAQEDGEVQHFNRAQELEHEAAAEQDKADHDAKHLTHHEKLEEERADLRKDVPLKKLGSDLKDALRFFHISDTHIDPFFSPTESMAPGQCHSCQFDDSVFGVDQAYCPDMIPTTEAGGVRLQNEGYAFGRYGCNPPHRLLRSLLVHLKAQDSSPPFVVFTGDIAPHGFPGDRHKLDKDVKLEDVCGTKLAIMREHIREFKKTFPDTKWAFAMGNNDHLPKNTYWQPWISALGAVFHEEGWFDDQQFKDFTSHGSHFVDSSGVRFLCIDFTLFTPGGETTFVEETDLKHLPKEEAHEKRFPVRTRAVKWISEAMADAEKQGLDVYLVGHQPLTTKKGKDELDVEGIHYGALKNVLQDYKHIIRVGFFGHRNLAGLQEILSPLHYPAVPSITAPGISPRGKNQPSYNEVYMHKETHVVLEFEQWIFNLMAENKHAQQEGLAYLGKWSQHKNDVYSWRALSGSKEFTTSSLAAALETIAKDAEKFFAIEVWKRAGYIGDETPENYYCKSLYDTSQAMMTCLFHDQDERCWNEGWLN